MTYEEIASSRSAGTKKQEQKVEEDNSPDRDSQESIEPLQERDLKATGPDPFDKLNYKGGELKNVLFPLKKLQRKNDTVYTNVR